jgi:uncharacterized cupredoxin-like copper-binding protein
MIDLAEEYDMKYGLALPAMALCACSGVAGAHGEAPHDAQPHAAASEETAFGRAGDARRVVRTIDVDMSDRMRFAPDQVTVKQGDTVRFRVKNSGRVMHEMVLGTLEDLRPHAELMRKHPGMEHAEPYMVHVAPGRTETMLWQFTKPGEFRFGCLVPGHFEAGMMGRIVVTKGNAK